MFMAWLCLSVAIQRFKDKVLEEPLNVHPHAQELKRILTSDKIGAYLSASSVDLHFMEILAHFFKTEDAEVINLKYLWYKY
jgi:hypothetical protein